MEGRCLSGTIMTQTALFYVFGGFVKSIERHKMMIGQDFEIVNYENKLTCQNDWLTFYGHNNEILVVGGYSEKLLRFNPEHNSFLKTDIKLADSLDRFSYCKQAIYGLKRKIFLIGVNHIHIWEKDEDKKIMKIKRGKGI